MGTPFLYRTTRDFLVRFGLNELDDLPKPEELDEDLAATIEGEGETSTTGTAAEPLPESLESEPAAAQEADEEEP